MASTQTSWHITGDFLENCNCDVVCPCTFSPNPSERRVPTYGACEWAWGFHVTSGNYGDVPLDDLNVAMFGRSPGIMAEGNWSIALYLDERASEQQRQALEVIFSGSAGGPLAFFTPFFSTMLGTKSVPIAYRIDGKRRSVEIPGILQDAVRPLAPFGSKDSDHEIWALNAHPFSPKLAMAVGEQNSTWTDYRMSWDNSGKNGHYSPINWSNA